MPAIVGRGSSWLCARRCVEVLYERVVQYSAKVWLVPIEERLMWRGRAAAAGAVQSLTLIVMRIVRLPKITRTTVDAKTHDAAAQTQHISTCFALSLVGVHLSR